MSVFREARSAAFTTRALEIGGRAQTIRRFRLEVVDGPGRGLSVAARGAELTVGSAGGNSLVLADAAVSRHHCSISATVDGFLVRDLGSTAGTILSGVRVECAYLAAGATLQLGDCQLRFEVCDDTISEPLSAAASFGEVVGDSPAMRRLFARLEALAPARCAVLLDGETGTGKGALARALHDTSRRAGRPFLVIDCAALSAQRLESALFGHERGAFSDAAERQAGAFEAAHGGTVFLDEIGEVPLELQPKLLRLLDGGYLRRTGSVAPIPVDVRVVAATSRDLRREVNRGTFRGDLFAHLDAARLVVPALRDRSGDIPVLAAQAYRQETGDPAARPPAELVARLVRRSFPGNVRELRAAVAQACASSSRPRARGTDAPPSVETVDDVDVTMSFRDAKERAVAAWSARYVAALTARFDGNLSRAARAVSMDRNHLRDLLKKYVGG